MSTLNYCGAWLKYYMTIWAFGDSFVADYKNIPKYKNQQDKRGIIPWVYDVGKQLNQDVHNKALCGSSPDYSYECFNNARDFIQDNDILIIGITNLDRRWLLRRIPYYTVWNDIKIINEVNDPSIATAIKQYLTHIDHREIYQTYCLDFLYNVDNLTKERNLHTIVLPLMHDEFVWLDGLSFKFTKFHWPNYPLTQVANNEYEEKFFNKIHGNIIADGKVNHLTWSNHTILANKIVNNINHKTRLDFENDFIKNTITEHTTNNKNFIAWELADKPIYNIR